MCQKGGGKAPLFCAVLLFWVKNKVETHGVSSNISEESELKIVEMDA